MDRSRYARLAPIAGMALVGLLVLTLAAYSWLATNRLRDALLVPEREATEFDIEILGVGGGRVVVERTPETEREGIWGLAGEFGAYGQLSTVIEVRDDEVERSMLELEGEFVPGEMAAVDQYAFAEDPLVAHGLFFEDVLVPGDLGFYPAWVIEGDLDTWVIVVHGRGDERRQALRILPFLKREGYPTLVVTFRNDTGAPESRTGLHSWGIAEWADVESAMEFARARGAEDFVLMGYSMGATIVAEVLHQSDEVVDVRGVVYDSAPLQLDRVVDGVANREGIPGWLQGLAKTMATLRFGVQWSYLDEIERASRYDVPVLLLHGALDSFSPVTLADTFDTLRPDIVSYERFDEAIHLGLWNADPERYEAAMARFLGSVAVAR